jgi:methyl-accepting chemotaxis protein
MKWFLDLSTRAKLFLCFGLLLVLLTGVIIAAATGITTIRQSQKELFDKDFVVATELIELRSDQNRVRSQILEMMMEKDRLRMIALEQDIKNKSRDVESGISKVFEAFRSQPTERKRLEELNSARNAYIKTRDEQIRNILSGRIDEAMRLALTVQDERYNNIRSIAQELGEGVMAQAKSRITESEKNAASLLYFFVITGTLALLFGIVIVLFMTRIIAKPLGELTIVAEKIASGDLGGIMSSDNRKDEVGTLTNAFSTMTGYLKEMSTISRQIAEGDLSVTVKPVSDKDVLGNAYAGMIRYLREMAAVSKQIAEGDLTATVKPVSDKDVLGNAYAGMIRYLREMAAVSKQIAEGDLTATVKPVSDKDILGDTFSDMIEGLRKMNQEIRDGVNILASSASQILASTTQSASGMTETATAVTETTTTVEEVKQTARLSAEKAKGVSDNSQKSVMVAQQGSAAVTDTMEGMNHIKGLMETVAESIIKLSEQTQVIGEVITVVSDLAQQSNILAVNAAIEASKAGEQGKGFSVVAQEIKSLADQSKQATEQVRTILSDIQKATSTSVLATEQVSKAVDAGVSQAIEAGESIEKMSESVAEASQAATQIAASSQQQLIGMEQVALAMENIKLAAEQNMAGAKQSELAAQNLNEFGQKLKTMVERYKV